jgi:hypothetical protein
MKRGSRFFVEFIENETAEKTGKKGRSIKMIEQRNEKLLHRFFYHSRLRQLKYESVLSELVNDFDLTESTLTQIIECNTKRIKEIGDKKLTRQKLKTLYPSFSWNDRAAPEPVKPKEVYNKL